MYAQRHVAGNRTHLNYYRNVKIHTNFKRSFISECTYKFLIDSLSLSLSFEKFTKYGIAKHLQRNTFNSDANSFHLHYENLFRTKMLSAKNAFRYVICVICFLRETTTKKEIDGRWACFVVQNEQTDALRDKEQKYGNWVNLSQSTQLKCQRNV